MATKVKLRKRAISGNRQTLYLDFYPSITNPETKKETRREFLGLYLFDKPKNPFDKQHNEETQALAEVVRAKRQIQIQNQDFDFLSKEMQKADFVEYFRELAKKRKGSISDNWRSALNYLEAFTGGTLRFKDLNEQFCNDFRAYLLTTKTKRSTKATLSQNSAVSYFSKFRFALKQAFKEGYLKTDLNRRLTPIEEAETTRQVLSLEEMNKLAKTDCPLPVLKQAALFSFLTGLRFSDIEKLVWGELLFDKENGFHINYRQKKTGTVEVLPISEQAITIAGERRQPNEKVFEGLKYSAYINELLRKWVIRAGIAKEITFHSFRHSFATQQLSRGTDIYTISKLLGHKHVETTEIYTRLLDKDKQRAANRIKLDI
jgi:integrase